MKNILWLLFLCFSNLANCQQNDYGKSWVLGAGITFEMSFTNIIPSISFYDTVDNPSFAIGNSNICDSLGNLLLASDGFSVYNANADTIDGGYHLVPDQVFQLEYGWSVFSQSSIFLPMGNGKYYFITPTASDNEVLNSWQVGGDVSFDLLLYNIIDMKANNGTGKVVKKMTPLLQNVRLSKSQMMACRHGDGKSWWLLKQAKDTNLVYKFLFTQDSVFGPYIQGFSNPHFSIFDQGGQSVFSKDGSQYATTCRGAKKVFVADFDRCTGMLSNPLVYDVPEEYTHNPYDTTEKEPWTEGLAFSPNGRFLYIAKYFNIQQLDLQDSNPNTAWETVAGLDTTWNYFVTYSSIYLGPDDKLYLGHYGNYPNWMSYFDTPNNKGAGSGYCKRCLMFPGIWNNGNPYNSGVTTPPCMPNYKLGASNPICWPLGIAEPEKEIYFKLYPNPTFGQITVRYQLDENEKGLIQITDVFGRVITEVQLNSMLSIQKLDMDNVANGVYFYRFLINDTQKVTGKIVLTK